jgi:hypothetical protein
LGLKVAAPFTLQSSLSENLRSLGLRALPILAVLLGLVWLFRRSLNRFSRVWTWLTARPARADRARSPSSTAAPVRCAVAAARNRNKAAARRMPFFMDLQSKDIRGNQTRTWNAFNLCIRNDGMIDRQSDTDIERES